jgi:hypothetical protein
MLYTALTVALTFAFIAFVIALLPDAQPFTPDFTNAITSMIGYIKAWGFFIDYSVLFQIVAIVLFIELGILLFNIVVWIIRSFRGTS